VKSSLADSGIADALNGSTMSQPSENAVWMCLDPEGWGATQGYARKWEFPPLKAAILAIIATATK
jgi:hypothetical protein